MQNPENEPLEGASLPHQPLSTVDNASVPPAKADEPAAGDVIVINQATLYYFLTGILFFIAGFAVAWIVFSSRAEDMKSIASNSAQQALDSAFATLQIQAAGATPTSVPHQDIKFDPTSPTWGPASAKVTVVEYSDFQCPYCELFFTNTYSQLKDKYGDKIRFVYQQFPLEIHPDARPASNAAMCAHEQGKFWDYHDILFKNQSDLSRDAFIKYATQAKIENIKQFTDCYDAKKYEKTVDLFLSKPFQLDVLIREISRILNREQLKNV